MRKIFRVLVFSQLMLPVAISEGAVFVLQPPSQFVFSGTFSGAAWQPQDVPGLSFVAPVTGEIEGTWEDDDFVVSSASLVMGLGLASTGFPAAGVVPGATGSLFNFAGRVDLGNGIIIDSTTYDFGLVLTGGVLFGLTSSTNLSGGSLSGISNHAEAGGLAAQTTSLAGGSASSIEAGPLSRHADAGGETIEFTLTVNFVGVTNFGGGQVPFTLSYSGQVVAAAVPEPGAALLAFAGLVGLAGRRRRPRA